MLKYERQCNADGCTSIARIVTLETWQFQLAQLNTSSTSTPLAPDYNRSNCAVVVKLSPLTTICMTTAVLLDSPVTRRSMEWNRHCNVRVNRASKHATAMLFKRLLKVQHTNKQTNSKTI